MQILGLLILVIHTLQATQLAKAGIVLHVDPSKRRLDLFMGRSTPLFARPDRL